MLSNQEVKFKHWSHCQPGHQTRQIPDLQRIRQDAVLQAPVERCLKELADSDKTGT